ncbi:MAG: DUF2946 family protein [Sphingobium sp.]
MNATRAFLLQHRRLALWLVAAALMMKMLVPAGFMPTMSHGTILVQLCSGMGPQTVAIEIPGLGDHDDGKDQHKAADQPCFFSGLTTPGLAGADPILLAIAIAFVLAALFRVEQRLVLWRGLYLRPPSQGPPATA